MSIISIETQNKFMKQLLKQLVETEDPTVMDVIDTDNFRELQYEAEKFLKQFD